MMAKAVKSTTKKRKRTKKKAVAEKQTVIEPEEQTLPENEVATATATATATAEEDTDLSPEEEALRAKKAEEESTHAKYERIKKGSLYLTDLQKLNVSELHDLAKNEGIKEYSALKKQDLVFRILKERINQSGLMYGEGVLEVLPDGYGFLRNQDITICHRRMTFMYLRLKSDASACGPEILYKVKSGPRKIRRSILPFCASKRSTSKTLTILLKRLSSAT